MIFGTNFNGSQIPDAIARRFRKTISIGKRRVAHLKGIAQSVEERDAMLRIADNGTRILHVETRHTAAGDWYGIYAY